MVFILMDSICGTLAALTGFEALELVNFTRSVPAESWKL